MDQPTQNPTVADPATPAASVTGQECVGCDRYPHADSEPCLYDCCITCGGVYSICPSTSPECGICAQAPASDDEDDYEPEAEARLLWYAGSRFAALRVLWHDGADAIWLASWATVHGATPIEADRLADEVEAFQIAENGGRW